MWTCWRPGRLRRMTNAWLRILLAGLIAILSFSAYAAQCGSNGAELKSPVLCSRMFVFAGACGRPNYPYPGWPDVALVVGAWEKVSIRIISISVDAMIETQRWKNRFEKVAMLFIGNSFNADPMTPYRYATAGRSLPFGRTRLAVHVEQRFPDDDGMQFPAGQPVRQTHIDVHLTCEPAGASYLGNMIVWYRLDLEPPQSK